MFADNVCMPKGGLGIISDKDSYVVLRSDKNELLLSAGKKWIGRDVRSPEVVIIYEGLVLSSAEALPARFDLSKAVVISFESDKVRFFDFAAMYGGFYRRPKD